MSDENEDTLTEKGIALILLIPITILYGYTIQILWGWFISPQFGLKPLSIGEALGLGLFISYTTVPFNKVNEKTLQTIITHAIRSGVTLGIGFIYLHFK